MSNSRFSVSIHILTLLAKAEGELLTSENISGSIRINPALIRKELINLSKHHLVASKEGKNGGVYLNKSPGDIRLSDVYHAVEKSELLGKLKNKPNPNCSVGKQINAHLDSLYAGAEKAFMSHLGKITLKKFASQFT